MVRKVIMTPQLERLLSSLMTADADPAVMSGYFGDFLRSRGVDHYILAYGSGEDAIDTGSYEFWSSMSRKHAEEYRELGYGEADIVGRVAQQAPQSQTLIRVPWALRMTAEPDFDPAEAHVIRRAGDYGLKSAVSYVARSRTANVSRALTLSIGLSSDDWDLAVDRAEACKHEALIAAFAVMPYIAAQVERMRVMADTGRPPLSPKEIEVLQWSSVGPRSDAIADKMGLSKRTVDDYIASARVKLGAQSLQHAVAIALRCGWID